MARDATETSFGSMQPILGQMLRELREEADVPLQEVADKTGISRSFLSLVEIGRSDLGVNRFARLCEFYGLKPSTLLRRAAAGTEEGQTRLPPHFTSPSEGSQIISLRPEGVGTALLPALTIYAPRAVTETFNHAGEEFVFVVEGSLKLVLQRAEILLKERESFYFSGEQPHRFENPDAERRTVKLSVQSEDRW